MEIKWKRYVSRVSFSFFLTQKLNAFILFIKKFPLVKMLIIMDILHWLSANIIVFLFYL